MGGSNESDPHIDSGAGISDSHMTTLPVLNRSGLRSVAARGLSARLCVCPFADPLDIGELNVIVDGNDAGNAET